MSTVAETSVSLFTSTLPEPTTAGGKIVLAVCIVTLVVCALRAVSPTRLTNILVSALAATEHTYFAAIEAGVLLSGAHTQRLTSLQLKVSKIRQDSLYHSQSHRIALREFFKGRTFTVLRYIREAQQLETDIEVFIVSSVRPLALICTRFAVSHENGSDNDGAFGKAYFTQMTRQNDGRARRRDGVQP
ncbi:hypothetical protein B0H11DRAFT_2433016 [Mycena galericulata]|nr:hypothetical protein B0H11DRAFT_2433016 [Mycena galericulata]